jgi:uncharacterized glyoxalase superfamily protein PhnB
MAEAVNGTMYPALFYRDAPAAIDWLQKAFGFEVVMVVPGEGDRAVAHSELRLGGGFIQVASADPAQKIFSPLDLNGLTQGLYIYWEDVDGIFARATAAGAEVEQDPVNPDYGGRVCGLRDLEGHRFWFGSYALGSYGPQTA